MTDTTTTPRPLDEYLCLHALDQHEGRAVGHVLVRLHDPLRLLVHHVNAGEVGRLANLLCT